MEHRDDKLPIFLLDSFTDDTPWKDDMNIVDLEFYVLDEPLHVQIGVRDRLATMADIVPMARALSAKVYQFMRGKVISTGFSVPCHRGCTVCCYHMICLSVPEAFHLMEEMALVSSDKLKKIMQTCHETAGKVHSQIPKIYFLLNEWIKSEIVDYYMQLMEVSEWYFDQRMACPFLQDNLCTIYDQRPIICSQHLVAGITSPCRFDDTDNILKIEMPISVANVLTELSSKLEHTDLEPVILPCLFEWYEKNNERHKRTWPAPFLVEQFVGLLLQFQGRKNTNFDLIEGRFNIMADN